jgi:hypothetical protein
MAGWAIKSSKDSTIRSTYRMIYIVHFADGRTAQVHAMNQLQGRRIAIEQFRGRIVAAITQAGLLDISFRRPPGQIGKN